MRYGTRYDAKLWPFHDLHSLRVLIQLWSLMTQLFSLDNLL
jgi:hypothetical protein